MSTPTGPGSSNVSMQDKKINEFARRCFRDTADQEYIAARLCWESGLHAQFRWQALHALEKYFKAILLYHRVPSKDIRHELVKLLKRCDSLPFQLDISPGTREFIERLDHTAAFRYLEVSFFITGPALLELDQAVWELRRYCRLLVYKIRDAQGAEVDMLPGELKAIADSAKKPPQCFSIAGGLLEQILGKSDHSAHAALVRNNGFFGPQEPRVIQVRHTSMATNAPAYLYPEVLDEVMKYIYFPARVAEAFKTQQARGQSSK